MSISDKITSIETHLQADYEGLENIGADLTGINKNILNIRTILDNIYNDMPKVTGEGIEVTLTPTRKGRLAITPKGNSIQEGEPTPTTPIPIKSVTGNNNVVVSNKNKLPSSASGSYTSNGATHTSNGKGIYTINETATGISYHNWEITPYTIKSGDYLHLGNSTANGNVAIALLVSGSEQIMFRSCSTANVVQDLSSYVGKVVNYVRTYTNAQTLDNYTLKPMICSSSTATDFVEHKEQIKPLNLGSIELNKIGDYQDYIYKNNDKWYKKEYIEKTTFNGTETGDRYDTSTSKSFFVVNKNVDHYKLSSGSVSSNGLIYCDKLIGNAISGNGSIYYNNNGISYGTTGTFYKDFVFYVEECKDMTYTQFQNWLSTHNLTVYYILANSTDIEITDTTLISQLEEIDKMQGYNGTTIITSTYDSSNAQMIISASALKGE